MVDGKEPLVRRLHPSRYPQLNCMSDLVPPSGTTVILISTKRKTDSCIIDTKTDRVTHWSSHPYITLPALELFAVAHTLRHRHGQVPLHFVCQFGSTIGTLGSVKSQSRLGNIRSKWSRMQ